MPFWISPNKILICIKNFYIFVETLNYIKMAFKPNNAWVVLPDPTSETTESGIILDDATRKARATNILEVISVGPQCTFIKPGDTAIIDPRTEAIQMDIDDKPCLLVGEHQIVGKQ